MASLHGVILDRCEATRRCAGWAAWESVLAPECSLHRLNCVVVETVLTSLLLIALAVLTGPNGGTCLKQNYGA